MADGKKQSFFSRLKWKRRRKKAEKIEKLQKEQLSEEETKIIDGVPYIPLRCVSEALGATVYYEEDTKITYITTKQAKRKMQRK